MPRRLLYVICGVFWILFALAGSGILWVNYYVARDHGFFEVLPMFLLSSVIFGDPPFLGVVLGLLMPGGGSIRKIFASLDGINVKQVLLFCLLLYPVYFVAVLLIGIPVTGFMDALGMPNKFYVSFVENLGDHFYYSRIISSTFVAFVMAFLGKKLFFSKYVVQGTEN